MNFDIVLITTGSRPRLLEQSLRSLRENAAHWDRHALTLVVDGKAGINNLGGDGPQTLPNRVIINSERQGASRSRNIGASSTPKYLRKDAVMFCDDDIYACEGWDYRLAACLEHRKRTAVSGHAHPYNHTILGDTRHFGYQITTVLSTVNITCPWEIWDSVGWFQEPGGAGASEDVDWCLRATAAGYDLALSQPHCVIHCGLTSGNGNKIVGYEHMVAQNRQLISMYRLTGVHIE